MNKKKLLIVILLALFAVLLAAAIWCVSQYAIVELKFYPKDAEILDLRQEEITPEHFDKLRQKMPECEILWNVPFQNGYQDSSITELTLTSLTETDIGQLAYFPDLKTVYAENCTDYPQLLSLRQSNPALDLRYNVPLDGTDYPQDSLTVKLTAITEEELALLPCLPQLETVVAAADADGESAAALQAYAHQNGLEFCICVGDAIVSEDAEQIRVTGITDAEISLLSYLPQLKIAHFMEPTASAETLLAFQTERTDLSVTWEKDICGLLCTNETTEVDLSEQTVSSIEEVEAGLAYFPNVTQVFLGEQSHIDNETIAAFRERNREQYKVVWVVDLSGKMKVRTDIDNFMPSRDGWGYVRDGEVDNIRYCEDLICIDLGHMGIKNVDFLAPLVNLEYLILAHTEVQYIDAISNCKKLKYLELDWSCIRDVSPLVECTALEDLNLGKTWPDITPILEMTWLKNLYMIQGSGGDAWKCTQALPNTRVVASGEYTVSNGWRHLPNYYKMRDILGMYYMDQ